MSLEKIAGTARVLERVIKVLRTVTLVCMIVIVAVLGVLTAVNIIDRDAVIGEDFNMIDVGPLTFEVSEEYAPTNGEVLRYAWIYALFGEAAAFAIYMALGYVRGILVCMNRKAPFHGDVARSIKKLSWLSLVLGLLQNAAAAVETTVAMMHFGIDKIAVGSAVKGITVNYKMELTFVAVFLVLRLMAYVFSYGAELQKLSDETL